MKLQFTAVLICTSLFAMAASAHNGLQHIMSTVKTISQNSIIVETADKNPKELTLTLLPTTAFQKDGADASVKDLKVGDRVVIHAKPDGGKLDAVTVEFGKMAVQSDMPGMKMPH